MVGAMLWCSEVVGAGGVLGQYPGQLRVPEDLIGQLRAPEDLIAGLFEAAESAADLIEGLFEAAQSPQQGREIFFEKIFG